MIKMKQLNKSTFRTIVIGFLVAVFFVGILLIYYNMLYEEKRDGIIKDGKMAASQSASQFDRFLSTNEDLIKISAYTLDEMIRDKKSDAEIQDYLVGQSTAIRSAALDNYTGLYGYINGRFFSGTNWIPPEGYDSTIRPWYTKPMETPGELTILEPYVDLQSGNTMLALGKTLCDGVSVISVDVSLDQMQKLTEDAVKNGGADIEMIVAGNGSVVTHSSIYEVGRNYLHENETLGSKIFGMLEEIDDGYFEVEFRGKNYLVYNAPFQGDWHCISIKDATNVFSSLTKILIATIVIVIATVIMLGFIVAISGRRSIVAEKALASSEAKSEFLSSMSHEIRTPINAVLGMNEMILRECEDKNILEYSESVKLAGNTLLGIVNDILDFSKIESGRFDILPVKYDLSAVLIDLVNMIKNRAESKGLVFNIDFDMDTPKLLYGDEVRLKQIITNILTNAVKYTEKGSITFSVSYDKIEDEPGSTMLDVSVKDTGIGIKEQDLNRLFVEFERIDEKRNRNIEGTGLGMNITQRLLEMMGSSLKVESTYGKGSTFSFSLKQMVISWTPLGDYRKSFKEALETQKAYHEKFRAPSIRVLAVDDNPMNQMVFSSLLKQTQIKIDTAERGEAALELCEHEKYDIIFLDHMMPGMDGVETLHELKNMKNTPNQNTPVICLTANAISGAREKYIQQGFDDYMTKPLDAEKLEKLLLKYIPAEKVEYIKDEEKTTGNDAPQQYMAELEELKRQKQLDVEAGIKNSGTLEAYIPLLKIFFSTIEDKAAELNKLCKHGDIKEYTIKVHSIKSSARIIGATSLGEDAQALENAGKRKNLEYIRKHNSEFVAKYLSFKDPLSRIFEEKNVEVKVMEKPEADSELMMTMYEELRQAADDMDCDRLQGIFKEMEGYRMPKKEQGLWKKLKYASENYDYEAIISLIGNSKGNKGSKK